MSSCLGIKLIRVAPGLATQVSHLITSNRALCPEPIQTRSTRSRIPVPSFRNTHSSSTVAFPATSPTLSRKPISVPTSSSRKTEDSILKHVERLRKVQATKSTFKTSTFKAVPKVAQPKPVSRPASRVPSSTHSTVSSSSSVARTDSSIDAHIQRIAKARESRPSSSRSSPATSRRVTPIQPLLIIKETASANVDLTTVDTKLAELSVASSSPQAEIPSVPGLRSCLKSTSAGKPSKSVHFVEFGGWQRHHIRVYTSDSAPNSFITIKPKSPEYTLLRPPPTLEGSCHSHSLLSSSVEICWPPEPREPSFIGYPGVPPSCPACRDVSSEGTPHTRSHATMQSIYCEECMDTPARRPFYYPALDIGDDDDGCSTCHLGLHDVSPDNCQIYVAAWKANINWIYSRYPERWPHLDAILAS